MSNMDKAASLRLPLQILLVLAVCVCSLAMHLVAEGLAPVAGGPGFALAAQGGHALQVNEHCEDNFIFPFMTLLPVERPAASLQSAVATEAHAFPISPLLPPPNS